MAPQVVCSLCHREHEYRIIRFYIPADKDPGAGSRSRSRIIFSIFENWEIGQFSTFVGVVGGLKSQSVTVSAVCNVLLTACRR